MYFEGSRKGDWFQFVKRKGRLLINGPFKKGYLFNFAGLPISETKLNLGDHFNVS